MSGGDEVDAGVEPVIDDMDHKHNGMIYPMISALMLTQHIRSYTTRTLHQRERACPRSSGSTTPGRVMRKPLAPLSPPPLSEDDVQVDDEVGRDTTHDGMLSDALRDNICADLYDDVCADGTDSVCVRVRMADQILLHV